MSRFSFPGHSRGEDIAADFELSGQLAYEIGVVLADWGETLDLLSAPRNRNTVRRTLIHSLIVHVAMFLPRIGLQNDGWMVQRRSN